MEVVLFLLIGVICIVLLMFSFFVNYLNWDVEKLSAYECGFEPFGDSKVRFEIRFYLVAILFVLFDIEIMICIPWIFVFLLDFFVCVILLVFFFFLSCGFVFEVLVKALDWR